MADELQPNILNIIWVISQVDRETNRWGQEGPDPAEKGTSPAPEGTYLGENVVDRERKVPDPAE